MRDGTESGTSFGTMRNIRSVTELKQQSSELVDRVNRTREPVIITQKGEARAVLQDVRSYEETQDSLAMLKLMVQSEADVRRGRTLSLAEVRARLRRSRR